MTEVPYAGEIRCQTQEEFRDKVVWPSVRTRKTLEAMSKVNRSDFAPTEALEVCYSDVIIPLGDGSSLSQPSLVGEMIDHLDLDGRQRVLEVGTGSGYNAAILSHLAKWVDTIEYNDELATNARVRLEELGYENVRVHKGDGAQGLPGRSLYDAIIITAAVKQMPYQLVKQLVDGGRIVAPVGTDRNNISLIVAFKRGGELVSKRLHDVGFYPLISKFHGGWDSYEEYNQAARYNDDEALDYGSIDESLRREERLTKAWEENQQSFDGIDDRWAEQSRQKVTISNFIDDAKKNASAYRVDKTTIAIIEPPYEASDHGIEHHTVFPATLRGNSSEGVLPLDEASEDIRDRVVDAYNALCNSNCLSTRDAREAAPTARTQVQDV